MEASRIAIKYMIPVIILSDGYLANGAEPWRIPNVDRSPEIPGAFRQPIRTAFCLTSAIPKRSRAPGPFPARPASNIASAELKSRK